jgi:PAS domain S-box-containing protein
VTEPNERHSRASLLAWAPGEQTREMAAAQRVEEELDAELSRQLVAESPVAGIAHVGLVAVVAALAWGAVPLEVLLPWCGAVAAAGAARPVVARRMLAIDSSSAFTIRTIRRTVLVAGLAWASATVVIAPSLPPRGLALLMVVFAGLVAGATFTLIGDAKSFHGFTAILVIPLAVAVLASGQSRFHLVAAVLLGVFTATMVALYRRAHAALRLHVDAAKRLELREQEAERDRSFLDALLTSAPDAIAAVSHEGRVLGLNPAFESLFGYTTDDVLGEFLSDLIVPESEQEAARELDQAVRSGRPMVVEVERRHRDGRSIPVRISAAAAGEEAGNAVFLVYDDLTAGKQIERALRDAEEQYRELVESASDLVWQVDKEGRWTFLNHASQSIYGAPPQDLLGHTFADQADPSHRAQDAAAFRALLDGVSSQDYETVHRDRQGRERALSVAARPVRDPSGAIVGARGIARDVSERVATRRALEQAREAAERTAQAQSAFLAATSHEIRTPMNGVLGMLELLLDSDLDLEERRLAELARTSAEGLLTVINDVLDYSRIEAGRVELEQIPFELPKVVNSVVRLLAVGAGGKGLEVACDIHPDVPRLVRGDPARLRQVLTNLIGNAVKFTAQGDVVVSAAVEKRSGTTAAIRFAVRDTGIGIPPEKLEFVFQDFAQADPSTSRQFGGTGLGLPISRRLVRLMGGELEIASVEGQGSEFAFTLEYQVEPASTAGDGPAGLERLKGARVLIADDNPTHRRIARRMLGTAGMSVDEVDGGAAALAALRQAQQGGRPYALAVLDAYMPGQDGFQVAAAVRADEKLSGTRLMMLTSAGQRGDAQRCRELGIEAYLPKPPARAELLEATAALLGGTPPAPGRVFTRYSIEETGKRLHVLVAEDNRVNQEVAAAMLSRRGHTVDVVADGREAVDAVRRGGVDVILMDIEMPGMDGVEATAEIRRDPEYGDVPIVALTAHATDAERERALAAGMDRYVVKPFKPHELLEAVEGWGLTEKEPEAAVEAGPPLDVDALRSMMREAGAEDAVERMLEVYGEDAPVRMAALERAVSEGEAHGIRQAAHAFKSAAGTIRATALASLLERVELAAKQGDADEAARHLPDVKRAHEAALAHLKSI